MVTRDPFQQDLEAGAIIGTALSLDDPLASLVVRKVLDMPYVPR
jgi:hypothetical protein